ncbi:MAG: hypothetical protein IT386_09045 [Deltaproteobacteria bacterium]|nr:hypothetical protein [Deltaproteobacteria bacterium]
MSPARKLALLAADAVSDGVRNRVGLFALLFALVVGLFADRCTAFDAGTVMLNGREFDVRDGAPLMGPFVFGSCALLLVLVTGFVACDALARPLSEGTATLWLSRPISRASYALSRLAGALGLGLAAGIAVLLVVTVLLHLRLGLDPKPALAGMAVFAVDAWIVAAVAMTLALHLPRVVALGAIVLALQMVVFTNGLHTVASVSGGLLGAIEHYGPPLGTGLIYALAPWFAEGVSAADWLAVVARLVVWGAGSTALLAILFRRIDLPG